MTLLSFYNWLEFAKRKYLNSRFRSETRFQSCFFKNRIIFFQISDGVCNACNGYYGPAHGQSVCPTCHAFLYANDLDLEVNVELASVERDGEDSDSGEK